MRKIKAIGLGLVAVVCLSAVFAGAASAALPEWGQCLPTGEAGGGKYSDPGCTVHATRRSGAYEWHSQEGETVLTPMTVEGKVTFETAAGKRIQCSSVRGNSFARITAPTSTLTPFWVLRGCEAEGQECHSSLSFEGEISNIYAFHETPGEESEPAPGWVGKLGFISGKGGSEPVVGFTYYVKNDERLFEPVECSAAIGTVWIGGGRKGGDAAVSQISPVNTMTTEFEQTYSESAPGVQSPNRVEGHPKVWLDAYLENHWEPVAIEASFHYEVEESEVELEIKATR